MILNKFDFSKPQCSKNVYMAPFSGLMDNPRGGFFHQGGPVWEDWLEAGRKRYLNGDKPEDKLPIKNEEPLIFLSGTSAWIGPQFPHFGHFIADSATRFLASGKSSEIEYFMLGDKPENDGGKIRPFVRDILNWFDINTSKVWVTNKPTVAENVLTFPQAEQRELIGPSTEYLSHLHEHQNSKLFLVNSYNNERIFVSRAGMPAHLAGESYLEDLFASAGFAVVRPEKLPLVDQLMNYSYASELVFTEGSALHALQLLGSIKAHVWVLCRRPKSRLIEHLLSGRTSELEYLDAKISLIHGCRLSGAPAPETGLAIANASELSAQISKIIKNNNLFNHKAYQATVERDLSKWLKHESKQERYRHPNYHAILDDTLKKSDLKKDLNE